MAQKKSPWSYDIKTNSITFDGRQTNLTTDDVVWSETVQANGIVPYGGITLQTKWGAGETLTDTMRQLIEKVVVEPPCVIFDPGIPTEYAANITEHQKIPLSFKVSPGKYLNDQSTGCTCSLKIYQDDKVEPIYQKDNITKQITDNILVEPVCYENGGIIESEVFCIDYKPVTLRIVFEYSDGASPIIDGASKDYLISMTIKADSIESIYTINPKLPFYYSFMNNGNGEINYSYLYEFTPSIDYDTDVEITNDVGDNALYIICPGLSSVKLYYHAEKKSGSGIDYADLLEPTDEYIIPVETGLVSEYGSGEDNGYIYCKLQCIEPFDNKNVFTLRVDSNE